MPHCTLARPRLGVPRPPRGRVPPIPPSTARLRRRRRQIADRHQLATVSASLPGSSVIRPSHVARFPTVRAIIQTVRAQPDLFLALANGAVPLALTDVFGLIAKHAHG